MCVCVSVLSAPQDGTLLIVLAHAGKAPSSRVEMGLIRGNPILGAYLAFVFLVSGAIVNVFQLVSLIAFWPFSRSLYRRINAVLVEFYWTGAFSVSLSLCLHMRSPLHLPSRAHLLRRVVGRGEH